MHNLLKAAVAISVILFSVVAPEAAQVGVKSLEGKPLPTFEMKTIGGNRVNNRKIKGHPVVIDFWATWCGPCKKVAPVMQELHNKFRSQGLIVIGANGLEEAPGPSPAKKYAKSHKYSYTFTHSNDKLMRHWGINGVPTLIFVDKSGKVVRVQVGYSERQKDKILEIVAAMVKG